MNNRCIIEQLGYKPSDKRVKIESDDYITAWIDENISVGANKDCTSIVLGSYNESLLQIDQYRLGGYAIVNITVPYTTVGGTDVTEGGIVCSKNDYYESIISLTPEGLDEYWKIKDAREMELILHKDMGEFLPSEIIDHIVTTIMCNEEPPKGVNMDDLSKMIERAIKPMIMMYLSRETDLVSGDEARQG